MVKYQQRLEAVNLRRQGNSYSEILRRIPVAKSTLSLWLRSVGLAKRHIQRLTERRISAARRGALRRKLQRIHLTSEIRKSAIKEVGKLERKYLWLVGVALYWAEGNKQKRHSVATGIIFSNSDGKMVVFFYKWLMEFCSVKPEDIIFELYIHNNGNLTKTKRYWSDILKIDLSQILKIRFKNGNCRSYRKNKGEDYHGLMRISVRRSTNLNRKIMGWVDGICEQYN